MKQQRQTKVVQYFLLKPQENDPAIIPFHFNKQQFVLAVMQYEPKSTRKGQI